MIVPFLLTAQVLATPITLDEVRAASRDNLAALQAELDVARADEGKKGARAAIFPQLAMQAQAGGVASTAQQSTQPPYLEIPAAVRGNFSFGLTLSQLIYDGGRWWNQIAQAGASAEAARGQLDEQRLVSQFEAERRFFELLRAQQALQVLRQTVDRSEQQLERARSLYEAGRGQKRDTLDAEVNLGNDQIQVVRAQQAIVSAQIDLLSWLARPTGDIEAVAPAALDGAPKAGPDGPTALNAARAHRPLLQALASLQRASEAAVEVAHAPYLPRVAASAGYSRSGYSETFFTDPARANAFSFGLSFQWDIFSGFATQAQVARARSDLKGQQLQLAQAERELEAEIRRATSALDAQLKIAVLAEKNRAIAELALRLSEERFNAGAGSTLEVRDAQIKLTQAQLTQVQGRIDVEIARASLGRIVGAPQ